MNKFAAALMLCLWKFRNEMCFQGKGWKGEKIILQMLCNIVKKMADPFLRRGLGAIGSGTDKPLLQIGATSRPPQRAPVLAYKIIAGERIKFGDISWESLYLCSLGER